MQDTLPVHEALLPEHAQTTSHQRIHPESSAPYPFTSRYMAARSLGRLRVATVRAMDHEMYLENDVLGG
jgi:hypothetical protein